MRRRARACHDRTVKTFNALLTTAHIAGGIFALGVAPLAMATRKGGLCAVPGCSRAAVHVHHLVFRSRGGGDEVWNGVALCAVHHLHGVHLGYLEVTGRAGERLFWRFATGEAFPTEEWETHGEDDVRRAGSAGGRGPPGGADRLIRVS